MTGGPTKGRGAIEVILFEEARFRGSLMFTSAEVTMGSDPGVMVHLEDPTVSPCHAVLRFDGETCAIENFDPIQGTLVNGESVERREVGPADEIRVGRFRLRITIHRADATPAPVSVRSPVRAASSASSSAVSAQGKVLQLPVAPAPPSSSATAPRNAPQAAPPARPAPPPVPPPAPAAGTSRAPTPPAASARTATSPVPGLPPPPAAAKNPAKAAPAPSAPSPFPASARPVAPAAAPPRSSPATASVGAVRASTSSGSVAAVAPTMLASTPTTSETTPKRESVPAPKPTPSVAQSRPALSAVPAESPASASRTSTQPIVSRYAEARPDRARPSQRPDLARVPSVSSLSSPAVGFSDDDDDDDAFFEPGFSLFERLRESGAVPHKTSAVEVVRFRQGCILKLRHLRQGEKLRLHGLRKPLGWCSRSGGFVFSRDALPSSIAVTRRGEPVDEASWRGSVDRRGRIALEPATQVLFPLPSGDGVLVHLVPAAGPVPKAAWRPRSGKLLLKLGGVSLVVHLIAFLIIGMASLVRRDYIAESKEGRFARIALKEVELEPPAPPVKPDKPKKKAKPEPSQVATVEPTHRSIHLPRTRAMTAPQAQSAATTQKLLSALGSISSGPKPMSATAMSNLAAVGPVRGGGFKVSGAIGRLPGDSLRLAAAGSGMGRLETKSTSDVAKNLGRVLGRGSSGQVRAQVTARPNSMKVEGHLDRGEIQRVINSHIHELQGCYERQLVINPNLAGKVTFEWVIGTSGGVTTVKIKASTLSSNEATSCMQAAIRRWQFPAPSGGQVTVIYPIALASSGT